MTRNGSELHPSDPAYDPVLDGVSRGLSDLFPPIHNPAPAEESVAEDDTSDANADDLVTDQS